MFKHLSMFSEPMMWLVYLLTFMFAGGSVHLSYQYLKSYEPYKLPFTIIGGTIIVSLILKLILRNDFVIIPLANFAIAIGCKLYVLAIAVPMSAVPKGDPSLNYWGALLLSVTILPAAALLLMLVLDLENPEISPLLMTFFVISDVLVVYILPICDNAYAKYGHPDISKHYATFMFGVTCLITLYYLFVYFRGFGRGKSKSADSGKNSWR